MKDLLSFLINNITGASEGEDFEIILVQEDGRTDLEVKAKPEIIGLIIGREGKTIKNIRKILSIRGVLENTSVNISVNEG